MAKWHRCPVCGATPSRADAELMDEAGGSLLVCPRDPWCWCRHVARDGEGVCEACGLKTPAPEVIDAEAAEVRPAPRETARIDKPKAPASPTPTRKVCSCKRRILLVTMASGAVMPVDPEPNEAGNIAVRLDGSVWRARVVGAGVTLAADEQRHRTHFETCPDAAKHRKKR